MLEIGKRLEPLWDDYLVDEEASDAEIRCHQPVNHGVVMTFDKPWEGDGCNYNNLVIEPDGLMRMYYLGWEMISADKKKHTHDIVVCYAESRDGIHWERPNLGLCEFEGSKDNNILLDKSFDGGFDNFFVFRDPKPGVPADELYKALYARPAHDGLEHALCCALSADGLHWRHGWVVTTEGMFDTLNTACYDVSADIYRVYLRGFHHENEELGLNEKIRDIRFCESKDFRSFTSPKLLDFRGKDDYPLYTNVITPYYRAPHIFTGFPSRYVERSAWSDAFEQIPGAEARCMRCDIHPRYGLAVTDCVFMSSRDGITWDRADEAFIRPGPENGLNWIYGDGYPVLGQFEVPGVMPGEEPRLAILMSSIGHWSMKPAGMGLYTIRRDGFISRHAGYRERTVMTKPFLLRADEIYLNLSTSARGYVTVEVLDRNGFPITGLSSEEYFGDSTDRRIRFSGDLSRLNGNVVRLRLRMRDADVYAIRFA